MIFKASPNKSAPLVVEWGTGAVDPEALAAELRQSLEATGLMPAISRASAPTLEDFPLLAGTLEAALDRFMAHKSSASLLAVWEPWAAFHRALNTPGDDPHHQVPERLAGKLRTAGRAMEDFLTAHRLPGEGDHLQACPACGAQLERAEIGTGDHAPHLAPAAAPAKAEK